ncbi:DUF4349 domain-containing protein [Kordia sp. YSTF-M3]|uniref:DUF4349 domain-containing protein n=1 Tax=Kordia aestuariivivens TaxID=2759037 RepID=A0ABR7QAU4_9FLAO|nr:DUF4349 domain-containing protein [Kordia aestuariivivens]MBC8755697.1 DUF4349 domain-containing protein [Kordia aestuariivivens]
MNAITLKRIVKSYVLVFLFLIAASCNTSSEYKNDAITLESVDLRDDFKSVDTKDDLDNKTADKSNGLTTTQSNQLLASNIPTDLKIIKTASTRYKVKNIEQALSDIKQVMYVNGGYISELRYDKNYQEKQNRFTIKIPKENFDGMLDGIQKFAEETDYVNISTTDVTEKYLDVQTRLKTKLEVKERLEVVLRKNAKTVKDILATEAQLRVIQEEIEAAQGKIKYMSSRVAYSTIQVEIYETITYKEKPVSYEKGFGAKAKEGLLAGWYFIQSLAIGILYVWPIILVLIIGIILFRRWRKA